MTGHNWFGDEAAKADPRGGVHTEEQFLNQYGAAIEELQQLAIDRYTAAIVAGHQQVHRS